MTAGFFVSRDRKDGTCAWMNDEISGRGGYGREKLAFRLDELD